MFSINIAWHAFIRVWNSDAQLRPPTCLSQHSIETIKISLTLPMLIHHEAFLNNLPTPTIPAKLPKAPTHASLINPPSVLQCIVKGAQAALTTKLLIHSFVHSLSLSSISPSFPVIFSSAPSIPVSFTRILHTLPNLQNSNRTWVAQNLELHSHALFCLLSDQLSTFLDARYAPFSRIWKKTLTITCAFTIFSSTASAGGVCQTSFAQVQIPSKPNNLAKILKSDITAESAFNLAASTKILEVGILAFWMSMIMVVFGGKVVARLTMSLER